MRASPHGGRYIHAGSRKVSVPTHLPSPAVIPILGMPLNKNVTDAWQEVFQEPMHNSAAIQHYLRAHV
jgi:hypothetical protein